MADEGDGQKPRKSLENVKPEGGGGKEGEGGDGPPPLTQDGSSAQQRQSLTEKRGSATEKRSSVVTSEKKASITEKRASATEKRSSVTEKRASQAQQEGSADQPEGSSTQQRASLVDQQQRTSLTQQEGSQRGSVSKQRQSLTQQERTSIGGQGESSTQQRGSVTEQKSSFGQQQDGSLAQQSTYASLAKKKSSLAQQRSSTGQRKSVTLQASTVNQQRSQTTYDQQQDVGVGPSGDYGEEEGEGYGENEGSGDTEPLDSFCQDHIRIPPQLPNILKQFTKAAIKTQPRDLDRWGAAYFRAMAEGQVPPVKETLEYPAVESKDGLTVGLLRILDRQLKDSMVSVDKVRLKWIALCLDERAFNEIIEIGRFDDGELIDWKKILAILCTSLGTNLTDTMRVICQVLTEQKEGGDPVIPYVVWWELYLFLARLDGTIPAKQLQEVNDFLVRRAHAKFCLIGPSDFLHVDCPPLY